jgi:nucleotide-binding universal stress UspA family protein
MITRILVPVDGLAEHETAVPVAFSIAARIGADVVLFSVVSPGLEATDKADLTALAEHYGGGADTLVLSGGDVGQMLLDEARREGTLTCMSSAGRGAAGEALLGSVSAELVRHSPRPVVLVGPHSGHELIGRRLAIAVDGTAYAETVIPHAIALADALELEPWLYHVVPMEAAHAPDAVDSADLAGTARAAGDHRTLHHAVLYDRRPRSALIELSRNPEIAMVALTTHGTRPFERLFVGSVAQSLVHRAATPVLAFHPSVSPPGFCGTCDVRLWSPPSFDTNDGS